MGLFHVIYTSQPFAFDEATLGNLLIKARQNNARDDITGALLCRRDIFLQLLEGPEDAVLNTLGRIEKDDRHLNIVAHVRAPISSRMFGAWAMLHDPAQTLIWPPNEVEDGTPLNAGPWDMITVFAKMARGQGKTEG